MSAVERVGCGGLVPRWLQHEHIERYRWAATMAAGKRVLDAACGSGFGTVWLSRAGAASVVGVDLSPETVAYANNAVKLPGVSFETGDACQLPFPAGTFDLYTSFETIEHVAEPDRLAAEARRVLAPGGIFLCTTPNRLVTNPGTSIHDQPYNRFHMREYTAEELTRELSAHFDSVTILGQTCYPDWYVKQLAALARRWGRTAVRVHQTRKVLTIPFDSANRHVPQPVPEGFESEVLVAVCKVL